MLNIQSKGHFSKYAHYGFGVRTYCKLTFTSGEKGEIQMKKRLAKGITAYYGSLEELAKAYNTSTLKRTKDQAKLESQREKFLGKCRVCGEPLSYLGGNVMACQNESCKGFETKTRDEDGNETVVFKPVFKILDEHAETIAYNLFD